MRDLIVKAAKRNGRSMNAEFVARLEASFKGSQSCDDAAQTERLIQALPTGIPDRLAEAAARNSRSMQAELIARLNESFQDGKSFDDLADKDKHLCSEIALMALVKLVPLLMREITDYPSLDEAFGKLGKAMETGKIKILVQTE